MNYIQFSSKIRPKTLGALLFNAGCNEQVFSPKPRKKIGTDLSHHF